MGEEKTGYDNLDAEEYIEKCYDKICHESLKQKLLADINSQVKALIQTEFEKRDIISGEKSSNCSINFQTTQYSMTDYMFHMQKEIEFLREQIKTRDEVIESLLNKKSEFSHQTTTNLSHENTDFELPKKTTKNDSVVKYQPINCNNRYSPLQSANDCNDISKQQSNSHNKEDNSDDIEIIDDKYSKNNLHDNIEQRNNKENIITRSKVKDNFDRENQIDNVSDRRFSKRKKSNKQKRYVAIIGDSIIKEVKGHLLTSDEDKVVVKSFPGATTKQMYDYANPTLDMKPDSLIIHVGTNDLRLLENDNEVVDNIMNLVLHCYNKSEIPIVVSSLTHREDRFKERIKVVNEELKTRCEQRNIGYIDNNNIGRYHLNRSKLHLNSKGSSMLARNFKNIIKN